MALIISMDVHQVIRVIRMLLILANLDEETSDSLSIAQNVGQRVQCLSCESRLVMDFQTMVHTESYSRHRAYSDRLSGFADVSRP